MRLRRASAPFPRRARARGGCVSLIFLVVLVCAISGLTWRLLDRHRLLTPEAPADALAGGVMAYAAGDLDRAVLLARRALAADPARIEAARLLVRALIYRSYSEYDRARDRQAAMTAAEQTVAALRPFDPEGLALLAFALQAADRPYEAAEAALAALERTPTDAFARAALGLAYSAVGAHDAAFRQATQALRDATDRDTQIDALRALAITYRDRGLYADALRTVEQALTINDHLLPLHFERAAYALQQSDYNRATVAYYQVLVYAPHNVKARMRLCELSTLLREHEAAITYCNEVIDRAPGWADGWYQLGREYFLHGDFAQARSALQQCARLQVIQNVPPADRRFECWYLQGQAAQITGDCLALQAAYREFQQMDIDDAVRQTWVYPPEGPPGCPFTDP